MCLRRQEKGKSKVLSCGLCLRDSKSRAEGIQFLHIHCSNVISYSPAPESNRQNRPDRAMDLPFFFRHKHITFLTKTPFSHTKRELPYWFQGNFVAMFVLNYWLREFHLSAFANRFELRCEPKQLKLSYCKICPCYMMVFNSLYPTSLSLQYAFHQL